MGISDGEAISIVRRPIGGARLSRLAFVLAGLVLVQQVGARAGVAQAQGSPNPQGRSNTTQGLELEVRGDLSVTLTDNALLSATDRVSDVAIGGTPGLNLKLRSKRVEASLDYSVNYFYFLDQNEEDVRHNLFGLISAEVIPGNLTVEARASVRQTFLDRTSGLSGSVANLSPNRRTVQTYTGSAVYREEVANWADVTASYQYTQQLSPADNLDDETLTTNFSDTESHQANVRISSGDRFNRFGWSLFGSLRRANRSLDVNEFRDDRAGAELSYEITRELELFATAGVTENSLQSAVLGEDGFTWTGGFRWQPSRRTSLNASYGQEGSRQIWTAQLATQPFRRVTLRLNYRDQIEANTFQLAGDVAGLQFNEDQGIVTPSGLPASETDPSFTLTDVDFRQRQVRLTLLWNDRRNNLFLAADWEQRDFDDGSGSSITWGASAGWNRRINALTEVNLTMNFRRSLFEGSDRVDDVYTGRVEYRKTFSRYFIGGISYSHSRRDSTVAAGNLEENAVALFLRGTF